jgi:hypothetical protein
MFSPIILDEQLCCCVALSDIGWCPVHCNVIGKSCNDCRCEPCPLVKLYTSALEVLFGSISSSSTKSR